ncbi:MAG: hypothetical protein ABIJ12_06540 [bacterium]
MLKSISLVSSVLLIFFIANCGKGGEVDQQVGDANTTKAVTTAYVTMPVGTQIAVTLVDSIDTDEQLSGTEFRAKLSQPIFVDGHTLFADGASAVGVLNRVVESGHLKTPAELDFSLTSIQDQAGNWTNIGTDIIQEKKGSHTNREVAMIGGGALVGGIIGKIINKDGSTEIGAVAGAAAGTGLSAATGKQDIFFGVGTEVVFISNQPTKVAIK